MGEIKKKIIKIIKVVFAFMHIDVSVVLRYMPQSIYLDLRSYLLKKRLGKTHPSTDDTIRICFLVQVAALWDKQKRLYEYFYSNDKYDVFLIVVPPFDFAANLLGYDYSESYFFDKYSDAIKAFMDNEWLDLKQFSFDYVFYQRPYDSYLPYIYRTHVVSKFSKCCYISYAFWPFEEGLCGFSNDVFRNFYYAFMESKENAIEISRRCFDKKSIIFCGYPELEKITLKDTYNPNNVLWTPRWTYGPYCGGSHFFEYKDELLELVRSDKDINLFIRPHPLAFDNYVRLGMMTQEDVDNYKKKIINVGAAFDENYNVLDTFDSVGILITDISSIIFPFLLSGKPIIFCNTDFKFSPALKSLLPGLYVVNDWDELKKTYYEIKNGNDYLYNVRMEIAREIAACHDGAVDNIINCIENDFYKNKRGVW